MEIILTPEERELSKKQSKLSKLESDLAQRELDLATLVAELHNFEARYIRTVGVCYADLDEIEAQIAEAEANLQPKNSTIQERAAKARTQAQETAKSTGVAKEQRNEKFVPSERLKKLYREVAKCVHPDLALDEKRRLQCQQMMAEANRAYEEGNEDKLRKILEEWEISPDSVEGEGIASELIRVIRKIAQINNRLKVIKAEFVNLKESDLFRLKTKVEIAENEGRDLLAEMALRVRGEIALANERLERLSKMMGIRV